MPYIDKIKRMAEAGMCPQGVNHLDVLHEDDCNQWLGLGCDCDCDVYIHEKKDGILMHRKVNDDLTLGPLEPRGEGNA